MHPKQFESILRLPAKERYDHFISRLGDWEELWGLKNENGFVSYGDEEGNKGIPFWPHPDYAKALATGEWDGYNPERIELKAYLDRWLTGMAKDGLKVVVFPTPSEKGIMTDPLKVSEDLKLESQQYE